MKQSSKQEIFAIQAQNFLAVCSYFRKSSKNEEGEVSERYVLQIRNRINL